MQLRRWMIVGAICVGLFAVLALYKVMQIRAAIAFAESFPERFETVKDFVISPQPWTQTVTALGEVVAPQSIELRNELEGRVTAVGFQSGARVSKGQVLVQLDAGEELAQLKAAQAEAELSQLALQRYKKLIKSNASSKDQYDQASAQNAIAVARAQALQARIDKKTLIAPFDAVAGLRELEPGQLLSANTLITALVGVRSDVWIDFPLPQQQADVAIGKRVEISVLGTQQPLVGKVIAADTTVSRRSRNLRIRAEAKDSAGVLKPGSAVSVAIVDTVQQIVVPTAAVRHDTETSYVYVISSVSKAGASAGTELRSRKRSVTLGQERAQQVVITSGLAVGETIAADGAYKLRDGMLVNVAPNEQKAKAGAVGVTR